MIVIAKTADGQPIEGIQLAKELIAEATAQIGLSGDTSDDLTQAKARLKEAVYWFDQHSDNIDDGTG